MDIGLRFFIESNCPTMRKRELVADSWVHHATNSGVGVDALDRCQSKNALLHILLIHQSVNFSYFSSRSRIPLLTIPIKLPSGKMLP